MFLDFSNYEDNALATTKRLLLSTEEFSVFSKGISVELEIMDTTPHPSIANMDHGDRPKVKIELIVIVAHFKALIVGCTLTIIPLYYISGNSCIPFRTAAF